MGSSDRARALSTATRTTMGMEKDWQFGRKAQDQWHQEGGALIGNEQFWGGTY